MRCDMESQVTTTYLFFLFRVPPSPLSFPVNKDRAVIAYSLLTNTPHTHTWARGTTGLTIPCNPASRYHLHFIVRETFRDGKKLQLVLSTTNILITIRHNLLMNSRENKLKISRVLTFCMKLSDSFSVV